MVLPLIPESPSADAAESEQVPGAHFRPVHDAPVNVWADALFISLLSTKQQGRGKTMLGSKMGSASNLTSLLMVEP